MHLRRWGHTCIVSDCHRAVVVFGGFGADAATVLVKGNGGNVSNRSGEGQTRKQKKRHTDTRLNSVAMLGATTDCNLLEDKWTYPDTFGESRPVGRVYHTAVVAQLPISSMNDGDGSAAECMIVFGGRTNPSNALNDVWILEMRTLRWIAIPTEGDIPPGLYRHSAVLVGQSCMVVYGGRTKDGGVSSEVYVLDFAGFSADSSVAKWRRGTAEGAPVLHSHRACVIARNIMLVFGGWGLGNCATNPFNTQVYSLDVSTLLYECNSTEAESKMRKLSWEVFTQMPTPMYNFGLLCIPVESLQQGGNLHILLLGGSTQHTETSARAFETSLYAFDLATKSWYMPDCRGGSLVELALLMKHACVFVPAPVKDDDNNKKHVIGTIAVTGGGANCFSFGSYFAPSLKLECTVECLEDRKQSRECIELTVQQVVVLPNSGEALDSLQSSSQREKKRVDSTAKPPVSCLVCGEAFLSRNKLNAHVRTLGHHRALDR